MLAALLTISVQYNYFRGLFVIRSKALHLLEVVVCDSKPSPSRKGLNESEEEALRKLRVYLTRREGEKYKTRVYYSFTEVAMGFIFFFSFFLHTSSYS